jgi:hypothetical protein
MRVDSLGVHTMGNVGDEPCISLHCYAPPYEECHVFDKLTGESKIASMAVVNQIPQRMHRFLFR